MLLCGCKRKKKGRRGATSPKYRGDMTCTCTCTRCCSCFCGLFYWLMIVVLVIKLSSCSCYLTIISFFLATLIVVLQTWNLHTLSHYDEALCFCRFGFLSFRHYQGSWLGLLRRHLHSRRHRLLGWHWLLSIRRLDVVCEGKSTKLRHLRFRGLCLVHLPLQVLLQEGQEIWWRRWKMLDWQ